MRLQEAIARQLADNNGAEVSGTDRADAKKILAVFELWLKHNGMHETADALETEHMP